MDNEVNDERVGQLLGGRYRLESIVGYGGMAAVYSGRHEGTGRPVAVKVLDDAYADDPAALRRFLLEGRIAAKARHPNVVHVFDVSDGAEGGCAYIVLELLAGETLGDVLEREGALLLDVAVALLLPLMGAVANAHARGVVHRDLKPENLYLHEDAEGNLVPKVVDFGVARDLADVVSEGRITRVGDVIGTPSYMSPEQARGQSDEAGPAADVWSMGVIWYEALTGALPFDGPTQVSVMVAINRAEYVPVERRAPWLPPAVCAVLNRALARDLAARYGDMGAFLDALLSALHVSAAPEREPDDDTIADALPIPFELTRRRPRGRQVTRSFAPRAR
jgi:serine/threonine protein kinase